ncbi:SAVMC3_10250 family protein [Streptomyces longwoodensis]|uniref:SAVMC3_10250 family protein n=1 Tax=Streptomyces longwoodensis TaxID=68231 RepID=UPI0036F7427C
MQELVYLSDAKLRQFVPEGRPRAWLSRLRRGRFDAPTPLGQAGIEVELAEPQQEQRTQGHLAEVMKHLDERSLWYQAPEAHAGRWVYFEAPFNTLIAGTWESQGPQTVLFMHSLSGDSGPDAVALLLHGSAHHLRVDVPTTISARSLHGIMHSGFGIAMRSFEIPPTPEAESLFDPDVEALVMPGDTQQRFFWRFIRESSARPETAAWMRGYARVTMRGDRYTSRTVLVATPLYVEYAHDLP